MPTSAIFICARLDEPAHRLLKSTLPTGSITFARHPVISPENLASFQQCDICFGNVPATWLEPPPILRWMQLESIGFEYYQDLREVPSGLTITNLKGLFASPAAESAIAGLLALYRGVDKLVSAQASARWMSLEVRPQMQLLRDKQVVILGHGSIGRKLRLFFETFGCRVQSFARTAEGAELGSAEALDHAIGTADIVACCLPKTSETRGLVDRRRLRSMRPSAILVNMGRGAVVDELALIECLQQQTIGGAVLDVTWQEPLPPGHPLWTCDRTILLQHTGGGYQDELLDKARTFLANFTRFQKGQPLDNIIDLDKGY